jgi:hypothetical protein
MNRIRAVTFITLLTVFSVSVTAAAAAKFPWSFDMSPDEVRSVTEAGPYKSFSNGDLETYNGIYEGNKENFQFFFKDQKLWRIGIYLYEERDPKVAAQKWAELHQSLQHRFGDLETPNNTFVDSTEGRDAFSKAAIAIAIKPAKSQMAPVRQPNDAFVFGSFYGRDVQGQRIYEVTLYLSKRT